MFTSVLSLTQMYIVFIKMYVSVLYGKSLGYPHACTIEQTQDGRYGYQRSSHADVIEPETVCGSKDARHLFLGEDIRCKVGLGCLGSRGMKHSHPQRDIVLVSWDHTEYFA